MTDPKDAKPTWPTGLENILREMGAKSLVDAVKKKSQKLETKLKANLPYKDDTVDNDNEPD